MDNKITYDDFKKVEIKVGKILSAEKIEGSPKLLKLSVSFGLQQSSLKEDCSPLGRPNAGLAEHLVRQDILGKEENIRQIISGIAKYFPEESELVGKKCMFVTNLEPRMIMGLQSNGMLFALGGGEIPFSLVIPEKDVPAGTPAN